MAGIKGKSGPPGNLNSVSRPWGVYWRRRALRPEDRWVLKLVEAYEGDLVVDKGGEANVTAGELRTIEIAKVSRTCWLLALAEISKNGITRQTEKGVDVHPCFREMKGYMAQELSALREIGMQKRPRPMGNIRDVIAAECGKGAVR